MPISARNRVSRRCSLRPSSGTQWCSVGGGYSTPSNTTVPLVGGAMKFTHRSRVLLPEPLGPMMHTTSPRSTSRSMPCSTSTAPNDLVMPPRRSNGSVLIEGDGRL